jgi:hypothetical protein
VRDRFFPAALMVLSMATCTALAPQVLHAGEPTDVRSHADRSFNRLAQESESRSSKRPGGGRTNPDEMNGGYSPDLYWIGRGQGDLTKGKLVCQRVSELSARTDVAKQIRVMVKEHMVDRVRERTGREAEQDIELTREEIVQEYLQGVKIVDHQIDEEQKICTATAVMPKTPMPHKQTTDPDTGPPTSR